jgi:hypothetical protein
MNRSRDKATRLRDRAEECRTLAGIVRTPGVQADYLGLASTYENLATNAEAEPSERRLKRPMWRKNAIKLRLLAGEFSDLPRHSMLDLADQWDAMADERENKRKARR